MPTSSHHGRRTTLLWPNSTHKLGPWCPAIFQSGEWRIDSVWECAMHMHMYTVQCVCMHMCAVPCACLYITVRISCIITLSLISDDNYIHHCQVLYRSTKIAYVCSTVHISGNTTNTEPVGCVLTYSASKLLTCDVCHPCTCLSSPLLRPLWQYTFTCTYIYVGVWSQFCFCLKSSAMVLEDIIQTCSFVDWNFVEKVHFLLQLILPWRCYDRCTMNAANSSLRSFHGTDIFLFNMWS